MKRARPTHLHLAIFAAATILAAPAAHALTFETKNYTDDSGLQRYTDPDKKVEQFLNNDAQKTPPGGTTFHFSVGPSKDDLFTRGGSGRFAPAWGSQPFPENAR